MSVSLPVLANYSVRVLVASLVAMLLSTHAAIGKTPEAQVGDNKIKLEVASSGAQIERGLMYRTHMPENQGMIFLFHPAHGVKFWMKNCYISLDMMMIKDGKIVKIFENVPPEREKPDNQCPTYPAMKENPIVVSEVVEVNGGYAKRHGVKEGDTIKFLLDGQK